MANQVQPIPEGFHTLTAYLLVADTEKEVEFAKAAFGGQTIHISRLPDGSIMHATLKIGTSMLMLGQVSGEMKPVASMLFMYVENVDDAYRRAVKSGGKQVHEPMDQMWGDRAGAVSSPNGIQWWIATHIAEVSEEELQERMAARRAAAAH
jgi:PhnB protein